MVLFYGNSLKPHHSSCLCLCLCHQVFVTVFVFVVVSVLSLSSGICLKTGGQMILFYGNSLSHLIILPLPFDLIYLTPFVPIYDPFCITNDWILSPPSILHTLDLFALLYRTAVVPYLDPFVWTTGPLVHWCTDTPVQWSTGPLV